MKKKWNERGKTSELTFPEFHYETEAKVISHYRVCNKGVKSLNRYFQSEIVRCLGQ